MKGLYMEISAITPRYNVTSKAQYDSYQNSMTNTYPTYVEEEEPKKSNLGMIALGVLGAAGIGYGIWKHMDAKALKKAAEEAKTQLDDVTKKLTEASMLSALFIITRKGFGRCK